jgi:hypothetical protein
MAEPFAFGLLDRFRRTETTALPQKLTGVGSRALVAGVLPSSPGLLSSRHASVLFSVGQIKRHGDFPAAECTLLQRWSGHR